MDIILQEYLDYEIFNHEKWSENQNDNFQKNLSRPGTIDAAARYRAAAQQLRNTDLFTQPQSYFH
jgi:hypothetical protein